MNSTRPVLAVAVAIALPTALVLWRAAWPEAERLLWLARAAYWAMPVVLLAWLWAGCVRLCAEPPAVPDLLRRKAPGVVLAALLTAGVLLLVPPALRVQFDETSLASTAQNMHAQRAALLTTGAVPWDGVLQRLENTVDKRPPLFAFLVSVLHDLTGARIGNAFAVNALLLAALLALAHAAARRCVGGWAIAAPMLLLATPLVPVTATSAGFELLAAVLLFVVVLAAQDCAARPSPDRVLWLAASGLLFAQARYESLAILLALAAVVLWQTRGRLRLDLRCLCLLAAAPALLAPLVLLLLHARRPDFYPEAAGAPLVSLAHGIDHLPPLLAAYFAPELRSVWPGALGIAGVGGYAAWRWHRRAGLAADLLVLLPVLAATGIALVWFHGDVREPIAARLFLPAAVAGGLLPLFWFRLVAGNVPRALFLAAVAALAAARLAAVRDGEAFPPLQAAKLTSAIDDALQSVDAPRRDTLWVTVAAQHLIVHGHAALSPEAFQRHATRNGTEPSLLDQLRGRGHCRTILFLTTGLDAAFAPAFGDMQRLLDAVPTEPVGRFDRGMPVEVRRVVNGGK